MSSLQGFPSDDKWDGAIATVWVRRDQQQEQVEPPSLDSGINIYDVVQHAFHIYNNVGCSSPRMNDGPPDVDEAEDYDDGIDRRESNVGGDYPSEPNGQAADPHVEDDIPIPADTRARDSQSRVQAILEDSSTTPLFVDAQLSCLSAMLLLLNCLRVHGISNALINELFTLFSRSVLPTVNSLPISKYSTSKMLRQLGLGYELIH
jgi:hypothetical protein